MDICNMIWTVFIWKINWAFSCIVSRLQATNIGLRCNLIFSVHWNKISSKTSPSMSILYTASRMRKVKSEQLKYKTERGLAWGWTRFMVLLSLSQVWSDNYFMMFNTGELCTALVSRPDHFYKLNKTSCNVETRWRFSFRTFVK